MNIFNLRDALYILLIPSLSACVSSRLPLTTPTIQSYLPRLENQGKISLSFVPHGEARSDDLCFYTGAAVMHAPYVRIDDVSNVAVHTLESALIASGVTVDDNGEKHVTIETTGVTCVPKGAMGNYAFSVSMRAQAGNTFSKEFSSEVIPDKFDCGIGLDARTSEGAEKIWQDCLAHSIKLNVMKLLDNKAFKDFLKYQ